VLGDTLLLESFGGHAVASAIALFLPGAIALLVDLLRTQLLGFPGSGPRRTFVELAYGFLPLVLFASLAHYLLLGLGEAGQILPVFWATWGLPIGESSAAWQVSAVAIAHPAVIAFLQGTSLIAGALLSIVLTQKIGRQSWRHLIPQHATTLGLTFCLWQLIL
jgi:hypothetical protein